MPGKGQRTSLVSLSSDAYRLAGDQNEMTRFRATWGTGGIFSPGEPLVPPESEKTRLWDFPVGWNFTYTPRAWEPISFAQLRALADNHDITRLVIETRKDQIEALGWGIKPIERQRLAPDVSRRIAALTRFWRSPDGEQPLAGWLREVLEDLLVLDAPALEIRRNRGGEIIGLDIVDGATITLLIDETGRRPKPPAPAYEQVIHGRPWRLLTTDDLLYMPRNRRPAKIYGFGPVEQIVMTVNIALRRQLMQLQHFTEGNVPPGLLNAPDNWTAEQIRQFQEWFDAILAGNTGARTRLVWGPAGARYQAFKEAPYKDEFDEWLARIVCYAFSLPPTPFVRQLNRATAETVQSTALEEGLAPLMGWVKRLIDHLIQDRMGHPDLEFAWSGARPSDPKDEAAILAGYVQNGIYTINEARAALGLGAVEGGDAPLLITPHELVPLAAATGASAVPGSAIAEDDKSDAHPQSTA